jgi:hypothetical protein
MARRNTCVVRGRGDFLRALGVCLSINVCLIALALTSCREEPAREIPPRAIEKRAPANETQREKPEANGPVSVDEKMKKARFRPRVIGGCGGACSDHKESIQAYLQTLYMELTEHKSIDFLETSEMVFNGKRLGDRWVQLWKDGQSHQRTKEIQLFSQEIHQWARGVTPEVLERAVAGDVSFGEDDGPGFLVFFRHPSFEGDDTLPVWRYRVQARGWEWLISEIQTKEIL